MILYKHEVIYRTGCGMKVYEMRGSTYAWPPAPHAHEYMQIWFVSKGTCEHKIVGRQTRLSAGQFFIVPPMIEHEVSMNDDSVVYGIDFPLELISEDNLIGENSTAEKHIKESGALFMSCLMTVKDKYQVGEKTSAGLEVIIKKMLEIYIKRPQFCAIELKCYLMRLLAYMFRAGSETVPGSDYDDNHRSEIDDVLLYIADHISERLYLGDVAHYAQMSVTSFNVYFKKYVGKTFVEYVNHLRIEKAQEILLSTGLTVSEVSNKVGISDLSYFNRIFKKAVGLSPGVFRKMYCVETSSLPEGNKKSSP